MTARTLNQKDEIDDNKVKWALYYDLTKYRLRDFKAILPIERGQRDAMIDAQTQPTECGYAVWDLLLRFMLLALRGRRFGLFNLTTWKEDLCWRPSQNSPVDGNMSLPVYGIPAKNLDLSMVLFLALALQTRPFHTEVGALRFRITAWRVAPDNALESALELRLFQFNMGLDTRITSERCFKNPSTRS